MPDARTGDDVGLSLAGAQLERRRVERKTVVRDRDAKRLGQPPRPGAEQAPLGGAAPPPHRLKPSVGSSARNSTALAEPAPSQTKLMHQWMP